MQGIACFSRTREGAQPKATQTWVLTRVTWGTEFQPALSDRPALLWGGNPRQGCAFFEAGRSVTVVCDPSVTTRSVPSGATVCRVGCAPVAVVVTGAVTV